MVASCFAGQASAKTHLAYDHCAAGGEPTAEEEQDAGWGDWEPRAARERRGGERPEAGERGPSPGRPVQPEPGRSRGEVAGPQGKNSSCNT